MNLKNIHKALTTAAAITLLLIPTAQAYATEAPTFSESRGYKHAPFSLAITSATEGAAIYYTTDCTTPSATNGILYTSPIQISHNATIRAIAIDGEGTPSDAVAATYLFTKDILKQSNTPAGYPSQWGPYSSISGTATADYEMDPEMTSIPATADSIARGLYSLPVMSIITDPSNLFSHEKDEETGGIYIYTGGDASSTGSGYGDGWLRAASVEFWEGDAKFGGYGTDGQDVSEEKGFQVNCAIQIHGNASRQAEKTPKHSLRMKMKSGYGPKKLKYELFGEGNGKKFNQVVIRAGFGNSWLHWLTGQQKVGMFTRDAWAKRMTAAMGHLSAATRFAHLYLNGMYWGLYNPTERLDADFCELHLGDNAEDYDVIRFDNGKIDCVDGTKDEYLRLLDAVDNSSDYATYQAMQGLDTDGNPLPDSDILFDADNFIDFMLLNYYGGNGDWDHHNWVTLRKRGAAEGFRWLPWDSEILLQGVNENILSTYNAKCPTHIFKTLMDNTPAFRQRFTDRAYAQLCEPFGMLRPDSAQAVWEQLTDEVEQAVWAEAARWGDYRRDVHQYTSKGSLYTKQASFDPQCEKMRTEYFPKRTDIVVSQLQDAGYWTTQKAAPTVSIDGEELTVRSAVIDNTQQVTIKGILQAYYTTDGTDPITYDANGAVKRNPTATRYSGAFTLSKDCTVKARMYHLKNGWGPLVERQFTVRETPTGVVPIAATSSDDRYYDLMGRPVKNPQHGIFIHHGKKIVR